MTVLISTVLVRCVLLSSMLVKQQSRVLLLILLVRVSVRAKTEKLLIKNRCNLVGICVMMSHTSVQILMIFDLDL